MKKAGNLDLKFFSTIFDYLEYRIYDFIDSVTLMGTGRIENKENRISKFYSGLSYIMSFRALPELSTN